MAGRSFADAGASTKFHARQGRAAFLEAHPISEVHDACTVHPRPVWCQICFVQIAMCNDPSVLGTPFYIMEHVQGQIYEEPSMESAPPELRSTVYLVSVLWASYLSAMWEMCRALRP